jgi:DNA-binding response OmpR family regulator
MPQRVLVIDDTDAILAMYRDALEMEGYEVITSTYCYTDVQDVVAVKPDLIILDYLFDGLPDGWDMLHLLKQDATTQSIPIIFATVATTTLDTLRDQLEAFGVQVLHKPFRIEELIEQVDQALDKKEKSR